MASGKEYVSETVSENGNEKVRNDARWHSEDASASVSDTEAETDNYHSWTT
jgi:hypothetical protein